MATHLVLKGQGRCTLNYVGVKRKEEEDEGYKN